LPGEGAILPTMEQRGFHTITLGCKLNQFDGAAIEGELTRRGFRREPDRSRAGVVVINTCTVTHKADAEARRLVRSVRRENPGCVLLVTGCYAELDAEALRSLDGVDRVFGNREKPRLGPILDELGLDQRIPGDRGCDAATGLPRALHFGDRTRAFLKIQEGCRLGCSYCVIPTVRGESRSVAADEVTGTLLDLVGAGYREIVLTGVNSGDWGLDLAPPSNLAGLLRELLSACGPTRIRLNSLEPLTVSEEIVALMASDARLAPHLQVPLQSGSETILRRMRRNYRLATYLERLESVRRAVPHAGLGADVIVGFPGETDALFEETCRYIERSPLNYLHVFSWSPRPGTPASDLPDRVPPEVVRRRSAYLRGLGERLGFAFRQAQVGRKLDAVALGPRADDGRIRALTGNFVEVTLEPGSAERGEPIEVLVERATADGTDARRVGRPAWAARLRNGDAGSPAAGPC
jgi:threonylcarbamoyladenosine tRNA methylthiotransferase MtaB